ncbi:MAG: M24 family metallopeptidase [Nitrososphaeria archaeon]|nr:Xaa-Pro peptidase family protein [Conexivisphaerales archaeon]
MQEYSKRMDVLLKEMRNTGCDGYVLTRAFNIYYLTGFWGAGLALIKDDQQKLLVSSLEFNRASENSNIPVEAYSPSTYLDDIKSFFGDKKVCIDESYASTYASLSKKLDLKLSNAIEKLREIKDEHEIEVLKEGGKIMDRVFQESLNFIKDGITERQLYAHIVKNIIELDGDVIPYEDTIGTEIVAFGKNTAFPHYSPPSNVKLKEGDPILLDLTLRHKGYVVDFTRTVFYKKVEPSHKEIYTKVKEAQELGIKLLKNGTQAKEIDLAVRNFFGNEKEHFNHSLGHGIGVEVHEKPAISYRSEDIIKIGNAVTIEPGLYYPNNIGVRIEDSLIVQDTPLKLFNTTTELTVI